MLLYGNTPEKSIAISANIGHLTLLRRETPCALPHRPRLSSIFSQTREKTAISSSETPSKARLSTS